MPQANFEAFITTVMWNNVHDSKRSALVRLLRNLDHAINSFDPGDQKGQRFRLQWIFSLIQSIQSLMKENFTRQYFEQFDAEYFKKILNEEQRERTREKVQDQRDIQKDFKQKI